MGERIRKINNAYETLSNPAKRSAYDSQMHSMEMRSRGMRVDTSQIVPKAQIPKAFMVCPMGHPDMFLRALGRSLAFQTRADVPEMGFGDFFEAVKFELVWLPFSLNRCKLLTRSGFNKGTGKTRETLQLSFGLSANTACSDVMLSDTADSVRPTSSCCQALITLELSDSIRPVSQATSWRLIPRTTPA